MMLAAMLAVGMLAASPALAQDDPAVGAVSKAGGVVAKAPCEPEPPKAPPPPPPAPAPAPPPPPKELPKTGGSGAASLFALGAGALLVAGGLVARRFVR